MLSLTSLALATAVGMTPLSAPTHMPALAAAVDSTATVALTDKQLAQYIAVKKALGAFWGAPANAELLKSAKSSGHAPVVQLGQQQLKVGVFDYPNLVKRDSALAAIFTTNHLAPEQFEPTQVTVFQALGTLVMAEAQGGAVPANTTTLGKNIELVKAQREALKAVGVALQVNTGDGMGGNNDDLNP